MNLKYQDYDKNYVANADDDNFYKQYQSDYNLAHELPSEKAYFDHIEYINYYEQGPYPFSRDQYPNYQYGYNNQHRMPHQPTKQPMNQEFPRYPLYNEKEYSQQHYNAENSNQFDLQRSQLTSKYMNYHQERLTQSQQSYPNYMQQHSETNSYYDNNYQNSKEYNWNNSNSLNENY